ncbi:MAG TPA: aldo/keto reductase, partial [Gaiellaceae bacterium]|nr:aldo/keto reductase [Gaiellaceae bacterium]
MRHADTATLGSGGPVVTHLGLGSSVIGGLFAPVTDDAAHAVVRRALELGIRYVDTAPLYGLGASERRVGEALADYPRDAFALSTKVGRLLREDAPEHEVLPEGMWHTPASTSPVFDFSRDGVRRSLLESLERLQLDRVDVAYVHDPDDHLDQAISEALPALAELRDEGVLGAVGAGMTNADALARIVRESGPDCILLAGRYTLLDQTGLAALLPLCERDGVAVVAGGVLNSGVLADPSPGARFDYRPAPAPVIERALRAAEICARHGVPLPAASLQFALGHPAVVAVLTGVRSVSELEANVADFDREVPPALWDDLVGGGI